MNIVFFIKSVSVNIQNYTIKDIPGSSGRLDVISRCILAALMGDNEFEKNVQIWVYLDNYGMYMFDSELLDYGNFPKNELLLSDYIVKLIRNKMKDTLGVVQKPNIGIITTIKEYLDQEISVYVIKESGEDFIEQKQQLLSENKIVFIIGDQSGDFLDSKELLELNLPSVSFGTKSYLASSVIRLINLHILHKV